MKKRSRFIPPAVRRAVLERDGHACVDCGVKETMIPQGASTMQTNLQLHHIYEFKKGGPHDTTNLVTVCMPCHKKRDREYVREAMRATLEAQRAERRARGLLNLREACEELGLKHRYQLNKFFANDSLHVIKGGNGWEQFVSRAEVESLKTPRAEAA